MNTFFCINALMFIFWLSWIYDKFICVFNLLGRGVFATTEIESGSFLAQYCGPLISGGEGDKREEVPSGFRYFFSHRGTTYW